MIDWTKPIETVGGRAAKVLSRGYWRNGETYCVVQIENDDGNSEIAIINPTTGGCVKYGFQIRNVPVKREGWVHVRTGTSFLGDYRIFETETEARKAASFSEQVVRMEWEE